jgi:hypothetical protein
MTALLRRYRSERLPLSMLVIVTILLAAAARAVRGAADSNSWLADAVIALLLFAQCRILDDLADRRRDGRIHPARVLVRARSIGSIVAAGLVLAACTGLILIGREPSGAALEGYLALVVLLPAWYAVRRGRTLLGDHLLLAKYPAFVWIIAASRAGATGLASSSGSLTLSMLATYLTACIYEALHDRRSPAARRPALVAAEALLLVLTLTGLSVRGHA